MPVARGSVFGQSKKGRIVVGCSASISRRRPSNLVAGDGELFSEGYAYKTCETYLDEIGKAWISPDSVVYRNGMLLTETVVAEDQRSYYRFRHLAKKVISARRVTLDAKKKFLLVTDAWSDGHYHCFTEVLPKLMLVRDRARDFVLLLPDSPYVRTIGQESLRVLSMNFADLVTMHREEFYEARNLYYLTRLAAPGQVNDEVMRRLRRELIAERPAGEKRIYISRGRATARKVLNETELVPRLKEYGFEVLYGEDFSLKEQIDIFSSCKTILGIHGAGLTKCMFMPPGGNVVELRKRERNYGYWHLSDALDHRYYYYHGVPDSAASLIGRGCNLTVAVDELERTLLKEILM